MVNIFYSGPFSNLFCPIKELYFSYSSITKLIQRHNKIFIFTVNKTFIV